MQERRISLGKRIGKDLRNFGGAYVLALPVIIYYILFHYKPLLGAVIAFKDFKPRLGIWGSKWVGLKYFNSFFNSYYFGRLIGNTLTISISGLLFTFPCAIIFALMINEVRSKAFKRTVQTISYMPHFISLVVVCSMITLFVDKEGFIVQFMNLFNLNINQNLLNIPSAFVPIYIISDIWQETGWNCIIYLAALGAIDPQLYEAARIDGANRWQQTLHVTLPGLARTIMLLLILRIGSMMSVGHEKIILLYNDYTMETADVISSYVYRRGLINAEYSFSTAVGLFNSVINFTLVVVANAISNKVSGYGIW
ncbi:MAG: ABC transporter permease [Aristaeellaceae bacterium]